MEEDKNQNQGLFDNNQSNNTPDQNTSEGQSNQSAGQPVDNQPADRVAGETAPESNQSQSDGEQKDVGSGEVTNLQTTGGDNNSKENTPNYPIEEGKKEGDKDIGGGSGFRSVLRTVIVIIIIAIAIWFFAKNGEENPNGEVQGEIESGASQEADNGPVDNNEVVSNDTENTDKADIEDSTAIGDMVEITAFYAKSGENNCAKVFALKRETEKKYDQDVVNTVRGLLTPLSTDEVAQGYTSNIPAGVYLTNVFVDGTGMATVKLNAGLNNVAGSCAVTSARAQIEQTLMQHDYVNSVTICAGDNCNQDEILQP